MREPPRLGWLAGLVLLVGGAAIVVFLVPLAACPDCTYAPWLEVHPDPPGWTCARCGNAKRVTLIDRRRGGGGSTVVFTIGRLF